ncbi:hypothetical protein EB155_10495 [archaeon]|nr:hypothetical protein [archaeon]NDB55006.1 hypothetical protein [archaeon]NDB80280.1 hypothetical protein [archaeon]
MTFVGSFQIDPKDYPFKKFIDEQKHLDTDELRHTIKPIAHLIDKDFKGKEHLYCDKSQLDENGKFKRPQKIIEAEQRGFKSVLEMHEADIAKEEDAKKKEVSDLRDFTQKQNDVIKKLIEKQNTLEETIKNQNSLLEKIISRLGK